jgi:hypothetical protein
VIRYHAEFEWRFTYRVDLGAMLAALGRAVVATKPQPAGGARWRTMKRNQESSNATDFRRDSERRRN